MYLLLQTYLILSVLTVGVIGSEGLHDIPNPLTDKTENIEKGPKSVNILGGDILLTEKQKQILQSSSKRKPTIFDKLRLKRKVGQFVTFWNSFPINFAFHSGIEDKSIIKQFTGGVKMWEENTCVRFREIPFSKFLQFPHIVVTHASGCFSTVGVQDYQNQQILGLAKTCSKNGNAAHEIGHSLGMWHEHSRLDRDKHITLIGKNFNLTEKQLDGMESDPSLGVFYTMDYGINFDYGSIMMYPAWVESKYKSWDEEDLYDVDNDLKCYGATMCPRSVIYLNTMGQRNALSFYDIKTIHLTYCEHLCDYVEDKPKCRNGGYPDPNKDCTVCKCPIGFGGDCTEPLKTESSCGKLVKHAKENETLIKLSGVGECNYLIKAPENHGIYIFIHKVDFRDRDPKSKICDSEYLELKMGRDLANTGARFCTPTSLYSALSTKRNQALVMYRATNKNSKVEFAYKLRYLKN